MKDLAARPYHLHCLRSCAKRVGAARQQLLLLLLVRLKAIWLDSCRLLLLRLLLLLLLKSQLVGKLLLRLLRLRLVRLLLRVVVVH